jgi:hypothetical protein
MSTSSQTRTMIMKICPIIEIISHRNQQPNTALEPTATALSVSASPVIRECIVLFTVASRRRGSVLGR